MKASYRVEIARSAEKQLRKLSKQQQQRLAKAMGALAHDPHPPGSRKLQGYNDVYRMRVGSYRIVYEMFEDRLIVLVIKIGHRRDVYR